MMCMVCGASESVDFETYHKMNICDDCYAVLDHNFKDTFSELKDMAMGRNIIEPHELDEASFIEALAEFAFVKCQEYNEERSEQNGNHL